VFPALDDWLAQAFTPAHLDETIEALTASQPDAEVDLDQAAAKAIIADCDAKLARHRQALEAGADPALVAAWTAEVQARKAQALATRRPRSQRMSSDEIRSLVQALGDIAAVLRAADPKDKAEV
jgi:site-specific DNA recombinase